MRRREFLRGSVILIHRQLAGISLEPLKKIMYISNTGALAGAPVCF